MQAFARRGGRPIASVLVADDDDLVRAGVAAVVGRCPRYTVCAEAASEREAISAFEHHRPRIAIIDLGLGNRDGLGWIKQLVARFSATLLLVLSDLPDIAYAERVVHAGARGYLTKHATATQLIGALDAIDRGNVYVGRHCPIEASAHRSRAIRLPNVTILSDRELHVFRLIGLGLGTDAVARELGLSRKTIESHREHLKQKLHLADAVALRLSAVRWVSGAEQPPRRSS